MQSGVIKWCAVGESEVINETRSIYRKQLLQVIYITNC